MKSDFSLARSANSFSPASGCAMMICGSFWNIAATSITGHVLLDGGERAEQVALHVELDLSAEQHGLLGLRR